MSMQRILLADDHLMFRQGIRALLEAQGWEIAGEASDGREAVRLARRTNPDIAVLDVGMPLLNGIDAAREMHRRTPATQTILLTMYEENSYVLESLEAGIRGYVLKAQAAEDLVAAIRQVGQGGVYLSPGISETLIDAYRTKSSVSADPLTLRERQVLQLVAEGKTTREIAEILTLSVKTADSHRTRMMKKLDIHDTAGLVRYAIRRGLIHA
ncbi:MAG TPA: response regulator transcription factor [Gammaproteobacteria bacterium]|nr:response regulator transcription factor [Gammaproteobacteria bacterium]